jgi:hypothetical protein
VTASAQFDSSSITGLVTLEVETDAGDVFRQQLAMTTAPAAPGQSADRVSTVARIAASARLKELDRAAGVEQAVRYRLVSPWTNWLVVAARPEGEQAMDIPALRKVPQTMAAGWGGVGAVASLASFDLFADAMEAQDESSLFALAAPSEPQRLAIDSILRRDSLDRDAMALSAKAQVVVKSLEEQAQRAEHDLREVERQFRDLRKAVETIHRTAEFLRRELIEVQARADQLRLAATRAVQTGTAEWQQLEAIEQALVERVADLRRLLAEAEELLERLQNEHVPLGHLKDVARKWARAIVGDRG